MATRRVRVLSADRRTVLAVAALADTAVTRMVGLLGRASLASGEGLVLRPCGMIHTWFMRFPIDVLFADRAGVVVSAVDALPPFRFAWGGRGAAQVIELPAGVARRAGVERGQRLLIEPAA
jgi:uncharacterized membrane protein (UPF0127 family)